jgi:3-hydroxy-9,10-secoandrosta-1,3,5(10)-triene-9,17-dione monooxygenase reductase component
MIPAMHTAADRQDIDARAFRDALGLDASGIMIITGHDEQGPIGFTCRSFYSVSAASPLISFSVMKTSTTYPRTRQTGRFAVNVLSSHQQDMSDQFARKGTDKWAGVRRCPTRAGIPVLEDTLMWLDCEIWAEHDAGDHLIVLGRVTEISPATRHAHEPLLYYQGRYRHLGPDETP